MTIKLSPFALGIALGLVWGSITLSVGLSAYFISSETPLVAVIGAESINYKPSLTAAFLGAWVAGINAFCVAAVVSWVYNFFASFTTKNNNKESKELPVKVEHSVK